MSKVTRRSFLQVSAGVAGGAMAAAGPAALAGEAAPATADRCRTVVSPTTGVPREPVMAYVRDADAGEVTLVAGTRETTYRDPQLVKRLLDAAPGT
jgi:hypothetical protein